MIDKTLDLKHSYDLFTESAHKKFKIPVYIYVLQCILGGWYVGIGAHAAAVLASSFYNVELGLSSAGTSKVAFGIIFSGSLLLIIYTGTDLFTSNTATFTCLFLSRRIGTLKYILYLFISLIGNFAGAVLACFIVTYLSGTFLSEPGELRIPHQWLLDTVTYKVSHGFLACLTSAIGCNIYVCLSIWIGYVMGFNGNCILTQILLIATFAVAGYEHIIANAYIINSGIMNNAGIGFKSYYQNLLPTLLGNFMSGGGIIGCSFYLFFEFNYENKNTDVESESCNT